ncbi:ABC transporter substrate-binding protein [Salinisphaera orenii]|uniref:ABC transporter substrate-binding protein n=1 Tax=Salinisphaera orenii TaxID=856731 RepID=UPI0013A5F3FB
MSDNGDDDTTGRSISRRRFLQSTAVTGGALALGSKPLSLMANEAPPAFPLGQLVPMTGSGSEYGPFWRDAGHLAAEQLNEAAKAVLGGPLISELATEDTNTLPTAATEAARKLIQSAGVPAITGSWSSGVTTAVATSATIPNQVLHVAYGSTSPLITMLPEDKQADLLFRTTASDALQGRVDAQLVNGEIFDDYKHKTAATLYVNNPYGQGLSDAFARSFEARGGTIQAQVPHPEELQSTYKSQLSAALRNNPDVLFLPSYPGHTSTFLKESRDIFDYTSWLFTDGNKSTDVIDAVGGKALAGSYGTAPSADTSFGPYKDFAKAYAEQKGNERVPPFTSSAYDAVVTIGLAAARVIAQGDKVTGQSLHDSLRPVTNAPGTQVSGGTVDGLKKALTLIKKGEDVDYRGAAGDIEFDKNGDVKVPVSIWRYTADGKIETIDLRDPDQIPDK